ncbi:alcohol dehydrogenase catalytic domain-containing protein [Alkaliphilus peptidifermentans]|uniref:L-iditol 2-dehydrogenase n=1 Tax=Alkaliphilus peptidifermentans DSM 18978 TaxID=1120976 RepID=A0A1G5CTN9_9FIRM|nr:alcohol dehydrogenase catalytic domain-containing protein [Alkaliphilus peptidifermentans]SCY05618.1 L-iditol 2-dehydrogenase [Alkaliphilus peptidifermentans DSM 18978]
MDKYKVSILTGVNETKIYELNKREPIGKEVLVKVDCCAICTLEQRVYDGVRKLYPFAGGHEIAGTVEKLGEDVKNIKIGDKVAVRTLNTCGECYYCRSGNENQCVVSYKSTIHEGFLGPGGFAEYVMVNAKSIYKVADDVDLKHAALTEPLACCIHSVNQADINLGDDVVVVGVGIMGALHIQLSKLKGARVIACEIDDSRLEVAKKMGADVVINSTDMNNVISEINKLTDNRGADVVFCTVPSTQVASDCIKITGKLGRAIMYTSFHPDNPVEVSVNHIHSSEMVITGAVSPKNVDFLTATKLISNKSIDLSHLITSTEKLCNIDEAYKKALSPTAYRIIVESAK